MACFGEELAASASGGREEWCFARALGRGHRAEQVELDFIGIGLGGVVREESALEPLAVVAGAGGEGGCACHAELRKAPVGVEVLLERAPHGVARFGEGRVGVGLPR